MGIPIQKNSYNATGQTTQRITGSDKHCKFNVEEIPTTIQTKNANASVEAHLWIDKMPHPGQTKTHSSLAHGTVIVHGIGFNDAPPKFTVKSIAVYEKGSSEPVATFKLPKKTEESTGKRGEKRQTYSIEVPGLDAKKEYIVVVKTGINKSKPAQVRSDIIRPEVTY